MNAQPAITLHLRSLEAMRLARFLTSEPAKGKDAGGAIILSVKDGNTMRLFNWPVFRGVVARPGA